MASEANSLTADGGRGTLPTLPERHSEGTITWGTTSPSFADPIAPSVRSGSVGEGRARCYSIGQLMPRKALGKKLRFAIFARDQFCCRYCGEQPPNVKLVVDHIIPVVEGGTNDDENLITACAGCNGGKGRRVLESIAPTDTDVARKAQECLEQVELAEWASRASEARQKVRKTLEEHWLERFGVRWMHSTTLTLMVNLVNEFDPLTVLEWIDAACDALGGDDRNAGRYISGCARNARARAEEAKDGG